MIKKLAQLTAAALITTTPLNVKAYSDDYSNLKSYSNIENSIAQVSPDLFDRNTWETRLYTVTNCVIERCGEYRIPDTIFDYLRIANGTSGDGNHQAGEYLDDGDVRSIAWWNRVISSSEMIDIVNTLNVKGMLIV